jgi:hypothetical protein
MKLNLGTRLGRYATVETPLIRVYQSLHLHTRRAAAVLANFTAVFAHLRIRVSKPALQNGDCANGHQKDQEALRAGDMVCPRGDLISGWTRDDNDNNISRPPPRRRQYMDRYLALGSLRLASRLYLTSTDGIASEAKMPHFGPLHLACSNLVVIVKPTRIC